MSRLAIWFGIALTLLGGALFAMSEPERRSVTALIPSFFGIALVVLGALAMNEKARMHAMHGAVLIGLVGLVVPAYRLLRANLEDWGLAQTGQAVMAILCGAFVALCIKSFVDARRRRTQEPTV